jgi:hypothetical protein
VPYYTDIYGLSGRTAYFSIMPQAAGFSEKTFLNVKWGISIFSTTFLILRRIQRDIINEHGYSREVPVILDGF